MWPFPYFAPASSPIPQHMPSSKELEKEIVHKYTRRSKNVISTSLLGDPVSTVVDLDPPHSTSCMLIIYFRLLRWILLLLQTWIFLLHSERVNNLVLSILFLILFPMIILPHYLISVHCLSFVSIPKSYQESLMYLEGSRPWMTRWMLSSHIRLGILCLLHLDYMWSVVTRCLLSTIIQMAQWTYIRLAKLHEIFLI